jgi:hypothetical protein
MVAAWLPSNPCFFETVLVLPCTKPWPSSKPSGAPPLPVTVTETDTKLFQGEAYQAKKAYLQKLEAQMWDSEPAPAGGPARWLPQVLGVAVLAVVAWRASADRVGAPPQAPPAAAQQAAARPAVAAAGAGVATSADSASGTATAKAREAAPLARGARVATGSALVAAGAPLTAEEAAAVVARLQAAKAEAMGPEHRAEALKDVMAGRLLRQWRHQAERAREAGRCEAGAGRAAAAAAPTALASPRLSAPPAFAS